MYNFIHTIQQIYVCMYTKKQTPIYKISKNTSPLKNMV